MLTLGVVVTAVDLVMLVSERVEYPLELLYMYLLSLQFLLLLLSF